MVDQVSWRTIFLLNVPLILVCLITLVRVPESGNTGRLLSLDFSGALLAMLGLGGIIYALTAGPTAGWSSPPVVLTTVLGTGALVALVLLERRLAEPMLRLSLFASRQFTAINLTTVLLYGALGAAGYLVVLQLQLVALVPVRALPVVPVRVRADSDSLLARLRSLRKCWFSCWMARLPFRAPINKRKRRRGGSL